MEDLIKLTESLNKIQPARSGKHTWSLDPQVDPGEIRTITAPIIIKNEPVSVRDQYRAYRYKVDKLTNEVAHLIPGIEKRGFWDHHIDHIYSVWDGFKDGVPPEEIAKLSNLQIIHYSENLKKGRKSHRKFIPGDRVSGLALLGFR